ncbi:MAG: sulfurtransferase TusA family protein [Clostridiales bacterium]|nr:sulfurtransferase TusA family protein [Clostridiales bacterium]MDD7431897.1 sulfurtransferase TusA family protein [Clostridiales bacterium]MDY3061619.1 sulfurtransferase TusA family protein [Eubacteriales bacterium]
MTEVDARGLSCPQPVLLLQEALKKNAEGVKLLVDDFAPIENCSRFAENHGYKVSRKDESEWTVLEISK